MITISEFHFAKIIKNKFVLLTKNAKNKIGEKLFFLEVIISKVNDSDYDFVNTILFPFVLRI